MSTSTTSKTFTLKECIFVNDESNLQSLLLEILQKSRTERTELISSQGNRHRFINHHRKHRGFLCGYIVSYTPGDNQPILIVDDNKDELEIEQLSPQNDKEGTRNEFIKGIVFFGIKNNHVIWAAHDVHSSEKVLMQHIMYLLENVAGIETVVRLTSPLPRDLRAHVVNSNSVTLTVPFSRKSPKPKRGEERQSLYHTVNPNARGGFMVFLKSMIPDFRGDMDPTLLEEALTKNEVEITIGLKVKRLLTDESNILLGTVAEAILDSDLGDIGTKLNIPNYGSISTNELTFRTKETIQCENTFPLLHDLFDRIVSWYERLREQNQL